MQMKVKFFPETATTHLQKHVVSTHTDLRAERDSSKNTNEHQCIEENISDAHVGICDINQNMKQCKEAGGQGMEKSCRDIESGRTCDSCSVHVDQTFVLQICSLKGQLPKNKHSVLGLNDKEICGS